MQFHTKPPFRRFLQAANVSGELFLAGTLAFNDLYEVGNLGNFAFGGVIVRLSGNIADFAKAKRFNRGDLVVFSTGKPSHELYVNHFLCHEGKPPLS
jgi:hypothetical protein